MSFQTNALAKRLEGRLMVAQGALCLVVEVDRVNGTARLCRGTPEGPHYFTLTAAELRDVFAAGAELLLDGVNNPQTYARLKQSDGQWFFTSREGDQGPFETDEQAKAALQRYILATQEGKAKSQGVDQTPRADGAERRRIPSEPRLV